ncbi:MAG: FAD:protein FMN transferase [Phycisphaerae bacterium]
MSETKPEPGKAARIGRETFAWILACALIGLLVLIGLYKHETIRSQITATGDLEIMATNYRFTVVVEGDTGKAENALDDAKAVATAVGVEMSTHLQSSPLSLFNRAEAMEKIELPPQTMEVLQASREFYEQTSGAFDVTILPIIQLYRQAAADRRSPTQQQIDAAREASRWEDILVLADGTAIKQRSSAGFDLGGVAKGYAIDKAMEVLRDAGVAGAMVDIGGDLRVWGAAPGGQAWRIALQDPFQPNNPDAMLCRLAITDAAVCTSGNYQRAYQIGQIRYSHIIDPRDPRRKEADQFPASVTVIAPTAMVADAWATALSVLGREEGMALLEKVEGVEALLVYGDPDDTQSYTTPGFNQYLLKNPPGLVRQQPQLSLLGR